MKAAAPVRRARREPTYFYKSASAVIEGKVRFGEGCIVLPHVRISVPPGCVLEVGPFTLFADFAEVTVTAAPPALPTKPAAAAARTTLRISSHNHFQSYARVHFDLHTSLDASPQHKDKVSAAQKQMLSGAEGTPAAVCAPSFPACVDLLGSGNVFQSFAAVHVHVYANGRGSAELSRYTDERRGGSASTHPSRPDAGALPRSWQLGDFNVFSAHACVHLTRPDPPSAPETKQRPLPLSSPAPTMPLLEGEMAKEVEDTTAKERLRAESEESARDATAPKPSRTAEPSPPGRVSVEERLFQDHSSEEDETVDKPRNREGCERLGEGSPSPAPAAAATPHAHLRTATASRATNNEERPPPSPTDGQACYPANLPIVARIDNMIFFSSPSVPSNGTAGGLTATAAACGAALPRYGIRSVSELPTVIKRIIDEEKQKRETDQQQPQQRQQQHQQLDPSDALTPSPVKMPESASPIAAAAAALRNLEGYVDTVHPELRAHTEEGVLVEIERVCRFYVRQYLEEADLYPVDAQYDDD